MRDRTITPENIIDIQSIEVIKGIKLEGEKIRIGALVTLTDIIESPLITEKAFVLKEAVSQIGSVQTRNQGTLVGNICNASPAADSAPALMVLGAKVRIVSSREKRLVPVEALFAGPKKNTLLNDELVTEIIIPISPLRSGAGFEKLGRRKGITLAIVNAAAYLKMNDECEDARLALGGVATTPIRLMDIEASLKGRKLTSEIIKNSSRACIPLISPVDDVRASGKYRREMSCVLLKRAIFKALARAVGEI
jgi:CO/xanthine dehydrogenase FAD-binding subunit